MAPHPEGQKIIEGHDKEARLKRNPHADFAKVESSRPDFDHSRQWTYSRTPNPKWEIGSGASSTEWKNHKLLAFDPYDPGRDLVFNYQLIISSTVTRPIALVSTISADGKTKNLAPFSYFQGVSTDVSQP